MAKSTNDSESTTVRVTLSRQSIQLLDTLAKKGIYGRNRAEVAGRFIDRALQEFVDPPRLAVPQVKQKK